MTHVVSPACFLVGIISIGLVLGVAAPAAAADIAETDALPLFLLGLFVTLMLFRLQTVFSSRGAARKGQLRK